MEYYLAALPIAALPALDQALPTAAVPALGPALPAARRGRRQAARKWRTVDGRKMRPMDDVTSTKNELKSGGPKMRSSGNIWSNSVCLSVSVTTVRPVGRVLCPHNLFPAQYPPNRAKSRGNDRGAAIVKCRT